MRSWLDVLDRVLRPSRPHLERCLEERERHLAARRKFSEERVRAIADCERRIEDARAVVFATNDGIVGRRMTDLEREWRWLSRSDPDAGLMDLWARIAPASWIDRKKWRGADASSRLDAAIALASDALGVEAAERAVSTLRPDARVRWRFSNTDSKTADELLAPAFGAPVPEKVLERALRFEERVHAAAIERFPTRPGLAFDLARAARMECVGHALARPVDRVDALRGLWNAGYVIAEMDASSITLAIPPLTP